MPALTSSELCASAGSIESRPTRTQRRSDLQLEASRSCGGGNAEQVATAAAKPPGRRKKDDVDSDSAGGKPVGGQWGHHRGGGDHGRPPPERAGQPLDLRPLADLGRDLLALLRLCARSRQRPLPGLGSAPGSPRRADHRCAAPGHDRAPGPDPFRGERCRVRTGAAIRAGGLRKSRSSSAVAAAPPRSTSRNGRFPSAAGVAMCEAFLRGIRSWSTIRRQTRIAPGPACPRLSARSRPGSIRSTTQIRNGILRQRGRSADGLALAPPAVRAARPPGRHQRPGRGRRGNLSRGARAP